jgi:hypothetical protein
MARRKKAPRRTAPASKEEPKMLDLSQFTSLDDALAKVEPGHRYPTSAQCSSPSVRGCQ